MPSFSPLRHWKMYEINYKRTYALERDKEKHVKIVTNGNPIRVLFFTF